MSILVGKQSLSTSAVDSHDGSSVPASFEELLRIHPAQLQNVDIARMNLLCAEGLPGVVPFDIDSYLRQLDQWALRIRELTEYNIHRFHDDSARFENSEPIWRLMCIASILKNEFRIHYREELKFAMSDSRDSSNLLLHGLLGPMRHGTCSSLPVLMVAIGRRLGYPMFLCHAPGHVFCRWEGLNSPNTAWRERHNIDYNGDDLNVHDDEYYRNWPFEWSQAVYEMERRRGQHHLYLRSLTPAEELASFLDQRANCLEDHAATDVNLLNETWALYAKAVGLSKCNWVYRSFAMTVHRKKLALALLRWRWSPEQLLQAIQGRFNGLPNLYPWEFDIGRPSASSIFPTSELSKPPPGFSWHETIAVLDPIAAVEQVFANRLGISRIAPSRFPPGTFGTQAFRYPECPIPLDPVHELCVFTGEPSPNPGRFVGSRGRSNTASKGEPPSPQRAT